MENSGSTTKKIYLNGKFVGEVKATGDYDKDAEIATQFLKEKGLYKERSKADFAFHQALSFAKVASLIYERELTKIPTKGWGAAPFVVNSVFSIELYLKALALTCDVNLGKRHDLLFLLDSLPEEALGAITEHIPRANAAWDMAQFRNALSSVKDAFIQWRYIYETDDSGPVIFPDIIAILRTLHDACRSRIQKQRPEQK